MSPGTMGILRRKEGSKRVRSKGKCTRGMAFWPLVYNITNLVCRDICAVAHLDSHVTIVALSCVGTRCFLPPPPPPSDLPPDPMPATPSTVANAMARLQLLLSRRARLLGELREGSARVKVAERVVDRAVTSPERQRGRASESKVPVLGRSATAKQCDAVARSHGLAAPSSASSCGARAPPSSPSCSTPALHGKAPQGNGRVLRLFVGVPRHPHL